MSYKVDDIQIIKSIGKGSYGEVFLSQKKGINAYLATKKMDRKIYENPNFFKRLFNELNIIMVVNHPNIIKYIDFKKTLNNFYLVTEFVNGGSLGDNLKKYINMYRKPFSEEITQHLMRQIVDALKYLHFNNIIHRDLKLDNILVNYQNEYDRQYVNLKNCQIKLIDFGFATMLHKKGEMAFTVLGTPNNMDPKILDAINNGNVVGYNSKVDIWSLGTICYEMVVGCSPFRGISMEDLNQKVQKGNYVLPMTLSEEIVSFINQMLQQDENIRADAKTLLNHPFLVNPVNSFHPVDVRKIQANYLPGGLISMESKQQQINNNINNQYNVWSVFNQIGINQGGAISTNQQIPKAFQNKINPQIQVQQPGIYSHFDVQNFQHY